MTDARLSRFTGIALLIAGAGLALTGMLSDFIGITTAEDILGPAQVYLIVTGLGTMCIGGLLVSGKVVLPDKSTSAAMFPHDVGTPQQRTHLIGVALAVTLLISLSLIVFSSSGRDDSYITYWAADSLATHGEILNYNGDRLEQSSSLLHVVSLALLHRITGLEFSVLGALFSLALGGLTILLVAVLVSRFAPDLAVATALLSATHVAIVYWSIGSLESTLTSFTVLHLILMLGTLIRRNRFRWLEVIWLIVATSLFVTVRPEMPVVLVCMIGGLLVVEIIRPTEMHRRVVLIGVVISMVIVMLFVYRWLTFGQLMPQPVLAKVDGLSPLRAIRGFEYLLAEFLWEQGVFSMVGGTIILVALVTVGWTFFRNEGINVYVLLSLLFLVAYAFFIVLSGGDWMELGRFLVPLIPIAMGLAALAFRWWATILEKPLIYPMTIGILLALQLTSLHIAATTDSTGMPVWKVAAHRRAFGNQYEAEQYSWFEHANQVHRRDIPTIDYLKSAVEEVHAEKGASVRILSQQMGMVPFYVVGAYPEEVEVVDTFGLVESSFLDCPLLREKSRGRLGVSIALTEYLSELDTFVEICDSDKPDIVFSLYEPQLDSVLADAGYAVVYLQQGLMVEPSLWTGSQKGVSDQFIAVDKSFRGALSRLPVTSVNFKDLWP